MKKLFAALIVGLISLNASAGGNIKKGEELAKNTCAACHATGGDWNKPVDPSYPKLAGQHADYLEAALVAYKRGEGRNGRANAIMMGQVQNLSKKDIQDISAYLHSLEGSLVLKR
jgi:cytochrome c553